MTAENQNQPAPLSQHVTTATLACLFDLAPSQIHDELNVAS